MHLTSTEELLQKFKQHSYLSTDSRKVMPGSLFFALRGDNFNASVFAEQALENGAAYAIIDDPRYCRNERTLLVNDVLQSLQQLASLYRSQLKIPIIGITGTNGKTTTKELIAAVLSTRFQTIATHGNFNNHIGVPLTLLSIKPDTEMAVVEMGANHVGEIAALCQIAKPTHGLITNIGKAHLEGFGGFEGVKKTKKELYDYLNEHGGTIFVNSSSRLLMEYSAYSQRITYGCNPDDSIFGTPIENEIDSVESGDTFQEQINETNFLKISLTKPFKAKINTQLTGRYNFENVMAALSIANHFRVDLNKSIETISHYKPDMNRSQVVNSGRNRLILDAYNANPSSMKVAIDNFRLLKADKKVAILGDMFELGDHSEVEHLDVINQIVSAGCKSILTAGPFLYKAAEGVESITRFQTTEELKRNLIESPISNATILIKGSRGMKLEILTEAL